MPAGGREYRTRAVLEVTGVAATGILHLLFEEVLDQKGLFIGLAAAAWVTYVILRCRREPGALAAWGFGRAGFGSSLRWAALVFAIGAVAMAVVAGVRGTLEWNPHLLPILALYPIWGLVQQFLVQALVARNLERLGVPGPVLLTVTSTAFAVVHWPDAVLMTATFLLGFAFTPIYLRHRNLWPLGVFHGWLGALAYFWILAFDPWADLIG